MLSFGDYINDLQQYEERVFFANDTAENRDVLNTAYSSVRTLRAMCIMCAAQQIKDSLGNLFQDTSNNNEWFESNSYSSDNSINVRIAFDKDKTVNPHEFLQRFNENNLTDADKEWADKIFMDIESEYQTSEIGKSKGNTIYSDYKANGNPIITADDLTKLNNNELTHQDISSKIVASMLSGDTVTIQKDNSKESTYINPSIHNDNEKSTGLARIFEVIWEAILSAVHKTSDRQKINEQINEMNDKFENNNTAERVKMSFNSLIEKSKDNNRQMTQNTNVKVKTNEKTNELPAPTKKR